MKRSSIALVAWASAALPAFAGGPVVVVQTPEPVVAPARTYQHDWSGGYVGLSFGTTSGDVDFTPGLPDDLEDGTVAGIYAGYLMQRGSFVYGGELSYGAINGMQLTSGPDDEIDYVLDLKARGGFAANRALFYGVVGYSMSKLTEDGSEFDVGGLSLGLGTEFAVSDRMTVGLEYLSRDLSGDDGGAIGIDSDSRVDSISLRVGLAF